MECALDALRKAGATSGRLLEVGAGTGFQAARFAQFGYEVQAVDVPESGLRADRVWQVREYDGRRVPFPDRHFDVVFSSNVLEHVEDLVEFQVELARVLKDDGVAVHILPTTTWRTWSWLSHYVHASRRAYAVVRGLGRGVAASRAELASSFKVKRSLKHRFGRVLFPGRHGERGNSLTEAFYFSSKWWLTHFTATGWEISSRDRCGIIYTGHEIFGPSLPIAARRRLARTLGSSTMIYVLRKRASARLPHDGRA